MTNPVFITVAPVGHDDAPGPRTPSEIADAVFEAYEAGASIAHLHVRDGEGRPTGDLGVFHETLARIRDRCDIVIEGSTGGPSEQSIEERSVALEEEIEFASLNMGSVNFFGGAYVNRPDEIRAWADRMADRGIVPNCCVFDLSMLYTVRDFHEAGIIPNPIWITFSLGFPDALPADAETLATMRRFVSPHAYWTFAYHGHPDLSLHAAALGLGGQVRVGFEDSHELASGRSARTNAELVEVVSQMAKASGRVVGSPDQVRTLLKRQIDQPA